MSECSSGCVAAEIKTVVFRVCTDAYYVLYGTDGVTLSLLIVPYSWLSGDKQCFEVQNCGIRQEMQTFNCVSVVERFRWKDQSSRSLSIFQRLSYGACVI
jgi:hypothetical protein